MAYSSSEIVCQSCFQASPIRQETPSPLPSRVPCVFGMGRCKNDIRGAEQVWGRYVRPIPLDGPFPGQPANPRKDETVSHPVARACHDSRLFLPLLILPEIPLPPGRVTRPPRGERPTSGGGSRALHRLPFAPSPRRQLRPDTIAGGNPARISADHGNALGSGGTFPAGISRLHRGRSHRLPHHRETPRRPTSGASPHAVLPPEPG